MIRSAREITGAAIEARDGSIGAVDDIYFDDQLWKLRYLVVDTGKWLPGRRVLIPPGAIASTWKGEHKLPVELTKGQVEASPDIDTAKPVSRAAEELLYTHYGWVPYWAAGIMPPPPPHFAQKESDRRHAVTVAQSSGEAHLQSIRDLMNSEFYASDGKAGHVTDFMIDLDNGEIRFLVIDTGTWLAKKEVLIPVSSISEVDWAALTVVSRMSRQEVANSPEYNSNS
jgi:uncharacterized protein YrrD